MLIINTFCGTLFIMYCLGEKEMKYEQKREKGIMCPLEFGLNIFGGRWKSRIICVLASGEVMRYSEIRNELGNITDTTLAAMLKELISDNMVCRKQYNEMPLKVEYYIAENGKSVLPILQRICKWSRNHSDEELDKKLPICKTCRQF